MGSRSTEKLKEIEERRKAITSVPMRVHEILGLPKSGGKSIEQPKCQRKPMKVKDLLRSMESSSKKAPKFSARRLTVAAGATGNMHDSFRNESFNATANGESRAFRVVGLSKSEGKKQSGPKMQPIRVKELLKSMEEHQNLQSASHRKSDFPSQSNTEGKAKVLKSQPIRVKEILASMEKSEAAGQKSTAVGVKTKTARRKLYQTTASPVHPQTIQENLGKSFKNRSIFNQGPQKSSEKPSRKSFLRPPNSIRDQYISRKASIIFEETTMSMEAETQNSKTREKSPEEKNMEKVEEHEIEFSALPAESALLIDSVAADSTKENEIQVPQIEIPRPSVIMGLTSSKPEKNLNEKLIVNNSDKSGRSFSRLPVPDAKRHSTLHLRHLDSPSTSLEDLLGNPPVTRESDAFGDLPRNSFLRNFENSSISLACMDQETLSWLLENLNICINSTEENLFLMKRMRKTINEIMEKSSKKEEGSPNLSTNNRIPNISGIEIAINDQPLEKSSESSISDVFEDPKEVKCNEIFSDDENKENFPIQNGELEMKQHLEIPEKPRRRSARLAAIENRSPKNSDASFTRLEAALNISHSNSKPATVIKKTPKRIPLDPRCNRSLREYMALKSSTKFLQTPDQRGLPTPKGDKIGTPAQRRAIERQLSRTVFKQLNDLYDSSS